MMEELIKSITLIITALIGVGLLSWGIRKKGSLRIAAGAVILIMNIFYSVIYFPGYAEPILAGSTLFLAVATVGLVVATIWLDRQRTQRDDRLRTEEREREAQLRTEQIARVTYYLHKPKLIVAVFECWHI